MIRSTTTFAMGAIVALVLGTGTAYAATGGKFILGRSNSASTTTTLSNPYGSALALNSKAGQPPLRVNRTTKVSYLNSDLLDGVDSSSFARVTTIGSFYASGELFDANQTPSDTTDDLIVAVATCPLGSQVTGGGGSDFTEGNLYYSSPDGTDSWMVISSGAPSNDPADVEAYARCYNPRGNVGSSFRLAPAPHKISAIGRQAILKASTKR